MSLPSIIPVPSMTDQQIDNVRRLEANRAEQEQIPFMVHHFIHAGLYSRTLMMPADSMLTGALIKIPTVIIVSGNVLIYTGRDFQTLIGYHVLPAERNRKQVFVAAEDTNITMLFPTTANNVKDAEEQFTDEFNRLTTRTNEV